MFVRADATAINRQHDRVPRRIRKKPPRRGHRAVGPAGRDRHRPSASSPPCSTTSPRMLQQKKPAGGARIGGVEDQPRPCAKPCWPRPSSFLTALLHLPDPRVQRFRAPSSWRARFEARDRFLPVDAVLWAARRNPPPDRKMIGPRGAGRGGCARTLDLDARRADRLDQRGSSAALMVDADHDQLLRVPDQPHPATPWQALEDARAQRPRRATRSASPGRREGAVVVIDVADRTPAPGFPAKAREHLFEGLPGLEPAPGGTGPRPLANRVPSWCAPMGGEMSARRGHHRGGVPHHHPGPRGPSSMRGATSAPGRKQNPARAFWGLVRMADRAAEWSSSQKIHARLRCPVLGLASAVPAPCARPEGTSREPRRVRSSRRTFAPPFPKLAGRLRQFRASTGAIRSIP